ncbi:hypothetical protein TWF594_011553 [Orbilia oligospora]|nr:hypothetical protein TWF706_007575 [Orbilia oligospora]KAF3128657.1 hypothetical protein TWF594_011553 [Orbilia oligospora]
MASSYYYHIILDIRHPSHPLSKIAIKTGLVPNIKDCALPSCGTDFFAFVPEQARSSCASHENRGGGITASHIQIDPASPEHIDYRFSVVTIESISMASNPQTQNDSDLSTGRLRGKSVSFADSADSHFSSVKARYTPMVSSTANIGYGVVHLYRETTETPGLFGLGVANSPELDAQASPESARGEYYSTRSPDLDKLPGHDEHDSTVVAILAVPAYMTPSDFLGYVGADTREAVSHFRLIRTGEDVRKYMALLKFRKLEDAKKFTRDYNGRVFNTMEPETCHVVFIKSVQFQSSEPDSSKGHLAGAGQTSVDGLVPKIHTPQYETDPPSPFQQAPATLSVTAAHLTTKPAPPPTASLLELPTCPVCLERMDETTGLLTTQCQHVFHCACLSKWKDGSCPVCRYTSSDKKNIGGRPKQKMKRFRDGKEESTDEDECDICFSCGAVDNLWVCLICGHVGCGRYEEKHAFQHYEQTQHCFAMDVDTQRVWDYASDAYVHRLVQNKSDGKLVELPSGRNESNTDELYDKLDNIGMEYTHLLTRQLDSQRTYFEEQVVAAADKATKASRRADEAFEKLQEALTALEDLKLKIDHLSQDVVPSLEKSKTRAERKAEKATELLRKFEKDWREEKTVNDGLLERVDKINKEREELLRENVDLKDQLRDMMFFVEGREKLKEMDEEGIEEGEVTIGDVPDGKKKRRGKGKGKR